MYICRKNVRKCKTLRTRTWVVDKLRARYMDETHYMRTDVIMCEYVNDNTRKNDYNQGIRSTVIDF